MAQKSILLLSTGGTIAGNVAGNCHFFKTRNDII